MRLLRDFLAFVSLSALASGTSCSASAPGAVKSVCTAKYTFASACELHHPGTAEVVTLLDSDDCGGVVIRAARALCDGIPSYTENLQADRAVVKIALFLLHQSLLFYDTAAAY